MDISEIIRSPDTGNKLNLVGMTYTDNVSDKIYSIDSGIIQLFPTSSLKNKYEMDYLEHYQNDAILFDYFENRVCHATAEDERRLRELVIKMIPTDFELLLDVGSGSGWLVDALKNWNRQIVSFDASVQNLAKISAKHTNSNFLAVAGDALNPPFAPNIFDVIVAAEIIEHLVEPSEFIKRMYNLLKPGAVMIISTPYNEILHYSQCIHCNRLTPKNAHLHSFDEKSLSELIKNLSPQNISFSVFGNKGLVQLRIYSILSFLPHFLWRLLDKIANIILPKPGHIIMKIIKGA